MKNLEIYGVDPNGEITPMIVRNAITKCFIAAHKEQMMESFNGVEMDSTQADLMVLQTIIKAFNESGGDFENPTKKSLLQASMALREFAKNFRSPEIIEDHFKSIKTLIDKLD
jgi:hypothetical protein